jgi:hypothetical protein
MKMGLFEDPTKISVITHYDFFTFIRRPVRKQLQYCTRYEYRMKMGLFEDPTKLSVITHYDFFTFICHPVRKQLQYCTRYEYMKMGLFEDCTKLSVITHYDFLLSFVAPLENNWQSLPCLASSSPVPATLSFFISQTLIQHCMLSTNIYCTILHKIQNENNIVSGSHETLFYHTL